MREIKFRAVFRLTNTVHDVTEIMWSDRTVYLVNSRGKGRLESLDAVDLLQFTGLHDKNGKEIYEGDVVKLRCGGEDGATVRHNIVASIEWDKDHFRTVIPDKIVTIQGGVLAGKEASWRTIHNWCGMHTCLTHGWGYVEIIGNIYENPELLGHVHDWMPQITGEEEKIEACDCGATRTV